MRVLHVDPSSEWRGGQRQLTLLVEGLAAQGFAQTVACASGGPLERRLPASVARLALRPDGHPANAWALRRWLARHPVDLVAAHSSHAHGLAVLAGARPVVHRRVDFPVARTPISRLKYARARGFICVSEAIRAVLAGCGVDPARCVVVSDGVRVPPKVPPASLGEGRVVLAVGALVDHKDHATLAAAAEGLEARVVVAGEGPLRAALAGGPLELLGHRDDVPALLARADVFVHSSRTEGMGQAVAEAMAAGVPVVVTAAGGVPELVGDAGLVVPPQDPDALRAALRQALAGVHPDPALARERVMTRFSVDAMVAGTARTYRRWGVSPGP
ncbi:MAG: glycosyltransferase [Alphaproteobacteria bacterium]|nr:glycosyltransferase [Alphaproteobacteria bacterium]